MANMWAYSQWNQNLGNFRRWLYQPCMKLSEGTHQMFSFPKLISGISGSYILLMYVCVFWSGFRYLVCEYGTVSLSENCPLCVACCIRNRDFQEVNLERDGETLLQFAAVYGFRNIQTLVHRMRKGRVPYQLVEVLSCPGGNAKKWMFLHVKIKFQQW